MQNSWTDKKTMHKVQIKNSHFKWVNRTRQRQDKKVKKQKRQIKNGEHGAMFKRFWAHCSVLYTNAFDQSCCCHWPTIFSSYQVFFGLLLLWCLCASEKSIKNQCKTKVVHEQFTVCFLDLCSNGSHTDIGKQKDKLERIYMSSSLLYFPF